MKKINVEYVLTDEQEEKLNQLVELRKQLPEVSPVGPENLFPAIMLIGSQYEIDSRLRFEELMLLKYLEQTKGGGGE